MGLIMRRRGFGALEQSRESVDDYAADYAEDDSDTGEPEAFAEGMFNTVEDEFYTYEGDPLDESDMGSILVWALPAWGTSYAIEDAATTQDAIVIGSVLDEGSGGSGSSSEGLDSTDASIKAAYAYGYERGQGDKMAGNPADPTAAVENVLMGAPSSSYGVLTTAARKGYADGYAGAVDQTKDPAKVDPKKTIPGGTTEAKAAGMSTGTMVAIGLGVGGLLVVGFMASKKRKRGR